MMKINFDEFPDRYKEKCRKWDRMKIEEHFGEVCEDIIPMWIADMDFKAPECLITRLHDAVDLGVFGYTYVYDEFYETIQDYYAIHENVDLEKAWITLCYGTVSTLHNIVQAFCQKQDAVIIQTPVYSPFHHAISAHGTICIEHKLCIKENRYMIDFDAFEQQLKTQRPKLYLLCTPHNPSGRVWSYAELHKLLLLCQQYGVIVVADEVHSGMIYEGEFTSMCNYMDTFDNIIVVSSANKKYNIGGLKTSYAIIKNERLRNVMNEQFAKNSITSPSVFGIIATISCMKDGNDWSKQCMAYIHKNYVYMCSFIDEHLSNVSYMKMESSYLLWINIHNTGISSDDFTREIARDYGVLVESGNHFVGQGEGWIRINLGTQFQNVKECCVRMKQYLD